jgi:hypothetical protein
MPVHFAGIVDPSLTCSSPECDIRTDLPILASPSMSKGKAPFKPFPIKLCATNDHPKHLLIFWAYEGQQVQGYTIPWTGHHIYTRPKGGEQFAIYHLQHSQVHKDVWYKVAWDDKKSRFFMFADATVQFPEITIAKRKDLLEEGDNTTKFTGDLTTALREAAVQVLPDLQPMTEDPQLRKKETTYAFKQGWLGIGTGAMFPCISGINLKAPAEPLPPK